MQTRVSTYSDTTNPLLTLETDNKPGTGVIRDTDGTVRVGPVEMQESNNTGATFNAVANYTTTATLDGTETDVTVDGVGGAFVLTLPAVAAAVGMELKIARKYTAGAVTIAGNGAEVILSNGASANTFVLSSKGQQVTLFCDGVQWYAHSSRGSLETLIADPGNAGAIAVIGSGHVEIVTAGAETRTLAAPTFLGQQLLISMQTHVGDAVITVATTYDQSAHTTITLNTVGDAVLLVAKQSGSNIRWSLVMNDGAALA